MLFVCGDTHGTLDISKLHTFAHTEDGRNMSKDDVLLIAGDAGVLWGGRADQETQDILSNFPWSTLYIDGNHENFDKLNQLITSQRRMHKFGKVECAAPDGGAAGIHRIRNDIGYVGRGTILAHENTYVYCFGGGYSIDKARRKNRVTWWAEEMPSTREYLQGLNTLEKWFDQGNTITHVVTHTTPGYLIKSFEAFGRALIGIHKTGLWTSLLESAADSTKEKPLNDYLSAVWNLIASHNMHVEWFFGHLHLDLEGLFIGYRLQEGPTNSRLKRKEKAIDFHSLQIKDSISQEDNVTHSVMFHALYNAQPREIKSLFSQRASQEVRDILT